MDTTYSLLNRPAFWVRRPLIIIHGIQGSILEDNDRPKDDPNRTLWSPRGLMYSVYDNKLDSLECDEKGDSVEQNIKATQTIKEIFELKILNMIISGDIFRGLEGYLDNTEGDNAPKYKFHKMGGPEVDFDKNNIVVDANEAEDVFYFVYDWRLDNSWKQDGQGPANNLSAFIEKITKELGCPKVNILAHSMGGLVCKSLLEKDSAVQQNVDKVIFLGTPNLGAIESFSTITYGLEAPRIGDIISDELNRLYSFDRDINFINDDQLKQFAQNMPSAYQLLPSEEYFNYYPAGYYELDGNQINLDSSPCG